MVAFLWPIITIVKMCVYCDVIAENISFKFKEGRGNGILLLSVESCFFFCRNVNTFLRFFFQNILSGNNVHVNILEIFSAHVVARTRIHVCGSLSGVQTSVGHVRKSRLPPPSRCTFLVSLCVVDSACIVYSEHGPQKKKKM